MIKYSDFNKNQILLEFQRVFCCKLLGIIIATFELFNIAKKSMEKTIKNKILKRVLYCSLMDAVLYLPPTLNLIESTANNIIIRFQIKHNNEKTLCRKQNSLLNYCWSSVSPKTVFDTLTRGNCLSFSLHSSAGSPFRWIDETFVQCPALKTWLSNNPASQDTLLNSTSFGHSMSHQNAVQFLQFFYVLLLLRSVL